MANNVAEMMEDINLDTMVNIVNNNPEHIKRAKEKAERVKTRTINNVVKEKKQVNKAKIQECRDQANINHNATLWTAIAATSVVAQIIAMLAM